MPTDRTGSKEDLKKRLRRIEGQVRGVARMVDEDRDCHELVQQLAAIRAATQQVSLLIARSYASRCLSTPIEGDDHEAVVDDLISVLSKTA